MRGVEPMARFGRLGILVFNALCFIEDDPVEVGLPRVQKRKLCCIGSIVKVDVPGCIVLHKFVKASQLLGDGAISG